MNDVGGSEPLRARFLKSAPGLADCPPDDTLEVALAGRSNAGKSSVLNRLTGTRDLARVSKTPGRTQLLNFFDVAEGGRLVDLPGYGYARASKQKRHLWHREIEAYLSARHCLRGVVMLMDCRHPFQESDVQLLDWARASVMPLLLLLNKCDKLKRGARHNALTGARRRLANDSLVSVQLFSATTGEGLSEALAHIREWLGDKRGLADNG